MAAQSSKGASSSSYRCTCHAFLSFRGKDTRKGFADHLYKALELAGFHTFRDDDEIQRGANIAAEIQKAIKESQVSIIVFSKDYASSTWCLDELAKIMERRRTDGLMVMPIFYDVDPTHVRKQTGAFAEAFAGHEDLFKHEMDKVEVWRRALREVADLGGMVLGDGYETQFIQDIVEEIGNKLNHKALRVAPFEIGIDDRVQDINMWLRDGSNRVGVAVICGMGGIGKTTIAKVAFNQNFHRFQGSSFLANIRETSEPDGLVRLQRKLLSDIQKGKAKKIYTIDEGISKIKGAVCCKRVLIVLDDVDHLNQFDAILGMREWFYPESKIIITTRREQLLKAREVCAMFQVRELNEHESLELFSQHAFGQAHPIEGYMELSRSIVQHCGGLPLALQILGSSLSAKKSVDVWRSELHKLDLIPDGEIQKKLRISFDSLLDDHDKSLFLHIACFFIGKKKDYIISVLDGLDFSTRTGIENLVDRCLVKINGENKLIMHQLLRDMGRRIIREESPDNLGKRSRVWHHKDVSNILRRLTGTETIKGLMLNLPMLMEDESSVKSVCSRSNKKRCHIEDCYDCSKRRRLGFFSWKSIKVSSTNSDPASNEVDFKTEAFRRMKNLEILLLSNVKINGDYGEFPKSITFLSWRRFPLKSIPPNFYLENLVALDLRNSNLKHVWKGSRFLPRLKIFNLSHSHGLVTTPDLSGLPNLERLILKGCMNLLDVDESIGHLEKLVFLNLKDCKNLTKLPRRISLLRSLQNLILSGCSKLVLHANMKKLSLLSAAKSWQSIFLWVSPRKTSFPSANLPQFLASLSLADCNLSEIPCDLSVLSSLKYLNLSDNPIMSLPENMNCLNRLQTLLLDRCTNLSRLPELPSRLKRLQAWFCTSLKAVTNLPYMSGTLRSNFLKCENLVDFQRWFNIKPLRSVDIEMVKDLGLLNLESIGSYNEVEMTNYFTHTTGKGPLQGVYECGIFSIFLHGNKIPDWYSYRSMGNSVLSIILPSHPNLKIRGLNACVVYAQCAYTGTTLGVNFETKGLKLTYFPVTIGQPKENEEMLWISHWQFGSNVLEGGEELHFSVDRKQPIQSSWTKEFAIQLVYEHQTKGEGVQSNRTEDITFRQKIIPYWSKNVTAGDVSTSARKYQLWKSGYNICNHDNAHLDFLYEPKTSRPECQILTKKAGGDISWSD